MKEERAVAVRRLLAFAVDWHVLVLWASLIFGAVMIATGGKPPKLESPWTEQVMSFLIMTVPFTLYFGLCESSVMQASLGKRTLGLVVSRETGGRVSFGSALLRNARQAHSLGVRAYSSLAGGLRGRSRVPGMGSGTGDHRVCRARVVARRDLRDGAAPV